MIKAEPIEIEVQFKYEVKAETRTTPIGFAILLFEPWTDDLEGLEILDKDCNVVGYLVKDEYDMYGEGSPYGWEYVGLVVPDGSFSKGDYFTITFKMQWDGTGENGLGILLFETWSHSVDGERYFASYRIGDEYNLNAPPVFTVPELPLGTITALVAMASAVLLRRKK